MRVFGVHLWNIFKANKSHIMRSFHRLKDRHLFTCSVHIDWCIFLNLMFRVQFKHIKSLLSHSFLQQVAYSRRLGRSFPLLLAIRRLRLNHLIIFAVARIKFIDISKTDLIIWVLLETTFLFERPKSLIQFLRLLSLIKHWFVILLYFLLDAFDWAEAKLTSRFWAGWLFIFFGDTFEVFGFCMLVLMSWVRFRIRLAAVHVYIWDSFKVYWASLPLGLRYCPIPVDFIIDDVVVWVIPATIYLLLHRVLNIFKV